MVPPFVENDPEQNRVARLLNTLLLALLGIFTFNVTASVLFNPNLTANLINLGTLFITFGILFVLRRGHVRAASLLTIVIFWLAVTAVAYTISGYELIISTSLFVLVLLAGLLIGRQAASITTAATIISGGLYLFLVHNGVLPPAEPLANPLASLIPTAGNLIAIAVILNLTIRDLESTLNDLNRSNAQLEESRALLERRVYERTKALETSASISRRLSTILAPSQLVVEVVEQVRQAFNYYHAHIYLLNDEGDRLIMAGGTGEAGRLLLARNHFVPFGEGLVGQAAATNTAVFIPDVSQDSRWLPNQLLPSTKAEIAVPIAIGGELLGVLDVQHDVPGVLTEQDVTLLQSVASQVAIALRNARAYEQAQAQAQREAIVNRITQRLQTAVDVDSVLQIAAKELGQALGARQTDVQIGNRQPGNGRSAATNKPTAPAIGGDMQ